MNEGFDIYNEVLQTLMNISTMMELVFSHLPPPVMFSHCKFCFSVVAKHIRSVRIVTTNFLCPRDWWIKTLSLKEKDYKTIAGNIGLLSTRLSKFVFGFLNIINFIEFLAWLLNYITLCVSHFPCWMLMSYFTAAQN